MPSATFCDETLRELARHSVNDGWVRGASAICTMYGAADPRRFETILKRLVGRADGSAFTQGATWLLARWQLDQAAEAARP